MSKKNPTEESTPTQAHTPGPWKISTVEDDYGTFSFQIDMGHVWYPQARMDADARLIAAAPDLLQACKMALPLLENYVQGAEEEHQQLRDAIYKAQGSL